uniref:Uncharacterized protein n=1 Tax=Solanum tuberosum TaxID=4113 RepID=M1DI50_SOLTU
MQDARVGLLPPRQGCCGGIMQFSGLKKSCGASSTMSAIASKTAVGIFTGHADPVTFEAHEIDQMIATNLVVETKAKENIGDQNDNAPGTIVLLQKDTPGTDAQTDGATA